MNLVEILKDTPLPVTLYSTVFGELKLFTVLPDGTCPLHCATMDGSRIRTFSSEGKYDPDGECVLFPSKENRDWSTFRIPFKDGDFIFTIMDDGSGWISIYKEMDSEDVFTYVDYSAKGRKVYSGENNELCAREFVSVQRLATEEEKEMLLKIIAEEGYKWNAESKELEELEESKFDPSTLKPFDKVLMRDFQYERWITGFFSYICDGHKCSLFNVGGLEYNYCIPFNEKTAHLVGTTQTPPEFYRV